MTVGDLKLEWDVDLGGADLVLDGDDLSTDEGLRQAVILSLFLDRRAEEGDVVEDGDRRGWWADGVDVEGDRWGSRLWLLAREKPPATWTDRAKAYASEALAWMVEDGVADRVTTTAEITTIGGAKGGAIEVQIHRPTGVSEYRFAAQWAAEGSR